MTLEIHSILCRAGTMDNYSYLIIDKESRFSAIIDPSELAPIQKACNEHNIKPNYILCTHHHYDHTDANKELKDLFGCKIIGGDSRIPFVDIILKEDDTFDIGITKAKIIEAKGHTNGGVLWYFPTDKALFTGDTLFNLCIGRLFEGSINEMFESLQKIKSLPDDVMFYPGHEYTLHCIPFASDIAPGKELIAYAERAEDRIKRGLPVHPVSLGIEKVVNPYLSSQNLSELRDLLS